MVSRHHETPDDLDDFFEREEIDRYDYYGHYKGKAVNNQQHFWIEYWNGRDVKDILTDFQSAMEPNSEKIAPGKGQTHLPFDEGSGNETQQ